MRKGNVYRHFRIQLIIGKHMQTVFVPSAAHLSWRDRMFQALALVKCRDRVPRPENCAGSVHRVLTLIHLRFHLYRSLGQVCYREGLRRCHLLLRGRHPNDAYTYTPVAYFQLWSLQFLKRNIIAVCIGLCIRAAYPIDSQIRAIVKTPGADGCHTLRNGDCLQILAIYKCIILYGLYALRKCDVNKSVTPGKCIFSYDHSAFRNLVDSTRWSAGSDLQSETLRIGNQHRAVRIEQHLVLNGK